MQTETSEKMGLGCIAFPGTNEAPLAVFAAAGMTAGCEAGGGSGGNTGVGACCATKAEATTAAACAFALAALTAIKADALSGHSPSSPFCDERVGDLPDSDGGALRFLRFSDFGVAPVLAVKSSRAVT
jgi:hypothetical protein